MADIVLSNAIADWEGTGELASVVATTDDPTVYWVVVCNPDGSSI